jgi:hypothetical protein
MCHFNLDPIVKRAQFVHPGSSIIQVERSVFSVLKRQSPKIFDALALKKSNLSLLWPCQLKIVPLKPELLL